MQCLTLLPLLKFVMLYMNGNNTNSLISSWQPGGNHTMVAKRIYKLANSIRSKHQCSRSWQVGAKIALIAINLKWTLLILQISNSLLHGIIPSWHLMYVLFVKIENGSSNSSDDDNNEIEISFHKIIFENYSQNYLWNKRIK